MSIYYLYVKTHNITGLKYLGKTQQNPFTYRGSGVRWRRHLKIHGNNVTTKIIGTFETLAELSNVSRPFSQDWDVVKSDGWANLIEETGVDGGWNKNISPSKNTRQKMSKAHQGQVSPLKGKHHSEEQIRKNSESHKGQIPWNKNKKGLQISWNKNKSLSKPHKQALCDAWILRKAKLRPYK